MAWLIAVMAMVAIAAKGDGILNPGATTAAGIITVCGASPGQILFDNAGSCGGETTVPAANGGAGTINGALKGNGAGIVSQAACADLSNAAASCSTDATIATNITTGTLPNGRLSTATFGSLADPVNLGLSAVAAGNQLSVGLVGANGSAASASNPVYIPFRSTTLATGTPVWATLTGALTIITPSSGATLGSVSTNVPFRFWVVALFDGSTLDLGLINCSTATTTAANIFSLNEAALQTTTILNGSSTNAGVIYSGTARTSFAARIIGYLEYNNGLTTAGTYASGPTEVQLMGPGVKKPGDIIQRGLASTVSNTTVSASTTLTTTNVTINITPTSTINLVRVATSGTLVVVGTVTTDITTTAQIYRGSTAIGKLALGGVVDGTPLASTDNLPIALEWIDAPASVSAQTYAVKIQNSANTASTSGSFPSTSGGTIIVEEIQG